jgi:hypothetical protein
MKLPLLALLTLLPCAAWAQATTGSDTTTSTNQAACSGPKHRRYHHDEAQQLQWLTTKLGLSSTQQGQIGPVLSSRDTQMKTIFQNTSLSKEQKHEQVKALVQSSKQQIESYLNPTQVQTFEQLHHHHGKSAQ